MKLLKKYKHIILYLVFGIGTTGVNYITYILCAHIFQIPTVQSTCLAWITAVLFAYITNRIWVFESRENKILKEIISFFLCRFATGIVDLMTMYVCVDLMKMNDMIIKLASNFLVIILNYVASKLVIFKKREETLS